MIIRLTIALILLGSLSLLIGSLKPQTAKPSRRIVCLLAGLSGLCYALCDLYWHFYGGLLRSRLNAAVFYVIWHLLGGIFVAMAISIVFPKGTKILLALSAVTFVALNCMAVFLYQGGHVTRALIASCDSTGFLIGMLIRYAILLRLGPDATNDSLSILGISHAP